jgi:hypothetical protein
MNAGLQFSAATSLVDLFSLQPSALSTLFIPRLQKFKELLFFGRVETRELLGKIVGLVSLEVSPEQVCFDVYLSYTYFTIFLSPSSFFFFTRKRFLSSMCISFFAGAGTGRRVHCDAIRSGRLPFAAGPDLLVHRWNRKRHLAVRTSTAIHTHVMELHSVFHIDYFSLVTQLDREGGNAPVYRTRCSAPLRVPQTHARERARDHRASHRNDRYADSGYSGAFS